jgi:flagellar biosynthesis/type III secretory pathway chaperone
MSNDITALAQCMKQRAISTKESGGERLVVMVDTVLAMVETLETKEEQRANWFLIAQKLGDSLDIAERRVAELTEFVQHVNKCLLKNGEYAPLSHEEIDTLLGIRAAGKGATL